MIFNRCARQFYRVTHQLQVLVLRVRQGYLHFAGLDLRFCKNVLYVIYRPSRNLNAFKCSQPLGFRALQHLPLPMG